MAIYRSPGQSFHPFSPELSLAYAGSFRFRPVTTAARLWIEVMCNSYTEFERQCSKALPWLPRKAQRRR